MVFNLATELITKHDSLENETKYDCKSYQCMMFDNALICRSMKWWFVWIGFVDGCYASN
jgi:hypothetical protein